MKKSVKIAGLAMAFTTAAQVDYEERFDESFFNVHQRFGKDDAESMRVSFLAQMIHIGLKPKQPEISEAEVMDVMDEVGTIGAVELIAKALELAFPEVLDGDDDGAGQSGDTAGNVPKG